MAENITASQSLDWIMVSLSPDVCKTPRGDSTPPIPYPVTAQLAQAVLPVPTVRTNNTPLVVMSQSFAPMTQGDEPGVAGGIQSGTVKSICEPMEHSASVRAGGFPILRNGDICWMNSKNTQGVICGQPAIPQVPITGANPPVIPETAGEKSYAELYMGNALKQRLPPLSTADGVAGLGAAKQAWNTPIDTLSMLANGTASRQIAATTNNAAIQRSLGYSDMADAIDKSAQNVSKQMNESIQALERHKFPLNNDSERAGAAAFDIGTFIFGGEVVEAAKIPAFLEKLPAVTETFTAAKKTETFMGMAEEAGAITKATNTAEEVAAANITKAENPPGGQFPEKKSTTKNEGNEQCTKNCSTPGEPVDIVTGDFLQHLSVLSLPGTLPLSLSRFHRTRSQVCGLFGLKWMDEWSRYLELDAKAVRFTDHEGVTLVYTLPQNGQLNNVVNSRVGSYVLSGDIQGELSVFDRHTQQRLIFGETQGQRRRLSAIHDGYGNTASFIYQEEQLTCIRHSDGYELTLTSQNARVTAIDLHSEGKKQRLVSCKYDDSGMLAE